MKKVLFASTALVATAGVAAADVSFGGFGRFGLLYNEQPASSTTDETRLEQRVRLNITGTTETDGGVKFTARLRLQGDDNSNGTSSAAQTSAPSFVVESGALRVDLGKTSDVLDSGDVVDFFGYGVGLTSFAEQSNGVLGVASGFGVNAAADEVAPTVKVRWAAGDLTVAASYTSDSSNTQTEEYQIGAGYSFGGFGVGAIVGSQDPVTGNDKDFVALGVTGDLGPVAFSLLVTDQDTDSATDPDTTVGASFKYDLSAATELRVVLADDGTTTDSETYGIGFRHDLGGGVSLRGGVGESGGASKADLGVIFNF